MNARFTLVAFVLLLNCGASALDAIDVQQVAGRSRGLACVAGDADAIAEALARDGAFLVASSTCIAACRSSGGPSCCGLVAFGSLAGALGSFSAI